MSTLTVFKPGQTVPVSGQYEIVWIASGTRTGKERTCVKGEPFPPTPYDGQGYVLKDATRH